MTQVLTDCVALVTGASRGIGRASAIELARAGCELVLMGRDTDALEATAQAVSQAGKMATGKGAQTGPYTDPYTDRIRIRI